MPSNQDDDEITIHITIEFEQEDEYVPTVLDVASYNFVNTLHYYVMGFITLFIIGSIASLFS